MKPILFALGLLAAFPAVAQDTPAAPPPPAIDLEQRMLIRCSAAFALVADRQQRGEEWALDYPPLEERGREFFVRASARVIDEARLAEGHIAQLLRDEAMRLVEEDSLAAIMPVCLQLLDQAGL